LRFEELIQKLESFCAYQERCLRDIQNKLTLLEANESDSKRVINHLIKNRYFDQSRFAKTFAQGKLRMNKWGKAKIKAALINKFVENNIINEALSSIEHEEYSNILKGLIDRKTMELSNEKDEWSKKQKILRFLGSKGFSYDEIQEFI
jgi:regulatory protein